MSEGMTDKFYAMRPVCRVCNKEAVDGGGYWITKGWYTAESYHRGMFLSVSYPAVGSGKGSSVCSKTCARAAFEQMLNMAEERF